MSNKFTEIHFGFEINNLKSFDFKIFFKLVPCKLLNCVIYHIFKFKELEMFESNKGSKFVVLKSGEKISLIENNNKKIKGTSNYCILDNTLCLVKYKTKILNENKFPTLIKYHDECERKNTCYSVKFKDNDYKIHHVIENEDYEYLIFEGHVKDDDPIINVILSVYNSN